MQKNNQNEPEGILWIIRFEDGTLASFVGTKEGAKEAADKRAAELGKSYVIV